MVWIPPADVPDTESVHRAAAALAAIPGAIHRTPVFRSRILDEIYGKRLFLKAENLQKVGAFKARGACHAVSRLRPATRERGIITYSSGNHAQAVAHAARIFGCQAVVFMPEDAPRSKMAAVRRYGARIELAGTTSEHRRQAALREAERTGGTIVEPFDSADIMSGQGTAGLELLEEVPDLDSIYVPVGGGGLCSGIQLAAAGARQPPKVFGVEPSAACSALRSLQANEPVPMEPGPTIADGLRPVKVGSRPFAVFQKHSTPILTVEDTELIQALLELLTHTKLLVEPSGAAGLAAARSGPGERVGVILSGGNVDLDKLGQILMTSTGESRGVAGPS